MKMSLRMPMVLGCAHAIVDASTVTAIFRCTHVGQLAPQAAWGIVLAYDIVAFGSQALLGWCTDRFASPRVATLCGLALATLSIACCSSYVIPTLVFASIGNALFHLGAGANVLRGGTELSAPAGVFVAPGALGLAFGIYNGARQGSLWPLLLLAGAALIALSYCRFAEVPRATSAPQSVPSPRARTAHLALGLLLVSVMIRSLVGMSAAKGYARSDLLLLGLPGAAFLGKSLGGFIADRLGWIETSVVALLVSIPLIGFAPPALALLLGLFLFQMTMPVTLTAVARLLPHRLATAFGWTCVALIIGALPTMLPFGKPLCERGLLSVWILISIVSVFFGLRLMGVRQGRYTANRGNERILQGQINMRTSTLLSVLTATSLLIASATARADVAPLPTGGRTSAATGGASAATGGASATTGGASATTGGASATTTDTSVTTGGSSSAPNTSTAPKDDDGGCAMGKSHRASGLALGVLGIALAFGLGRARARK